jgi:iron(III) transport system substrate-binding protein
MRGWSVRPGLLVGALLVLACAPARQEAPGAPAAAPGGAVGGTPATWEQEWERTLAAARQEGKVVVAGVPTDDARQASTEPFERRYGISVQYEPLGGPQYLALVERMRVERAAGQYLWDLIMTGSAGWINNFNPMGVAAPLEPALILPEVKEPRNWRFGLEFADKERTSFVMTPYALEALMVNSRLVNPEEITSFRDLLDPKWKGQIIVHDPRAAGSGQVVIAFLYLHKDLGPDYLRALMGQDLAVLRDTRQELDLLGQGRYAVCIGCSNSVSTPLIERGVPIALIRPQQIKEGGYNSSGAGNVGIFTQAPHPNAARVYVNWLLGKEGQTALARALGYPSARLDIANDWADTWQQPVGGYWASYTEEALIERNTKAVPFINELFAGR